MKKTFFVFVLIFALFPSAVSAAVFTKDAFEATDVNATTTLQSTSISGAISILGEYITNLSNYVQNIVGNYISGSSTVPHVGGSAFGDLLFWTGGGWNTVATSSLGIASDATLGGVNTSVQFNDNGSLGGSQRFVWDNVRGTLIIGTSTDSSFVSRAKLVVIGTSTDGIVGTSIIVRTLDAGVNNFNMLLPAREAILLLGRGGGTMESPSPITSGRALGSVRFNGYNGAMFTDGRAIVAGFAAEDWTTTANGAGLVFTTTPLGTPTTTERMRIAADGNVGIGTGNPQHKLDVSSTGVTTVRIDSTSGSQGSCLIMKDSDGSGYTYITANDGTLTTSTEPCN